MYNNDDKLIWKRDLISYIQTIIDSIYTRKLKEH